MLIVGCGCRGQALARALTEDGHTVRGTTRTASRRSAIEAAGAEAVVAEPLRLGTLLPHLQGVSAMAWLMGTASGEPDDVAALHGPRLESIVAKLVDSHVRGVVYEAAGSVDPSTLAAGAETARAVAEANRVPLEAVERAPADLDAWIADMRAAVGRVLA